MAANPDELHPPAGAPQPISAGLQTQAQQAQTGIRAFAGDALNSFARLNSNYRAPLTSTAIYLADNTSIDPARLALVAALVAQQAGVVNPNLDSPLLNAAAEGQANQIKQQVGPGAVAAGIYQNVVGSWIDQWKQDPGSAALEMLAGFGLIAGAGALEVATGGAATPFVWAGFALLAAPTILPPLLQATKDTWQNPSDENVTKLLISTGTAAFAIGTPVRAFRGATALRQLNEQQIRFVHTSYLPGQVTHEVTKLAERAGQPGQGADIRDLLDPYGGPNQFSIVPQTVEELDAQIAGRAGGQVPIGDDESVQNLRNALDVHGQIARRVQDAKIEAYKSEQGIIPYDESLGQVAKGLKREQVDLEKEQLVPAMKTFAHRYGYVLARESDMPEMTMDEVKVLPGLFRKRVDERFRGINGILHAAGEGHGWDGMSDGVMHRDQAENLSEAMARDDVAGGINHGRRMLSTMVREAGQEAGLDDGQMENVWRMLEGGGRDADGNPLEPYWDKADAPTRYFASHLANAVGVMTNYSWKRGHMELPMGRYVARMLEYEDLGDQGSYGLTTRRLEGGLAQATANVKNRNWVADDWAASADSMAEEFDPNSGLRPLGDRLRQAVATREQFTNKEQAKREFFTQNQPLIQALRDPALNQAVFEAKRQRGSMQAVITRNTKKLTPAREDLRQAEDHATALKQQLDQLESALTGVKGKHGAAMQQQRAQLQPAVAQARHRFNEADRKRSRLASNIQRWEKELQTAQGNLHDFPRQVAERVGDERAGQLVEMETRQFRKLVGADPGGRKLVSGYRLADLMFGRYLRQMNQSRFREAIPGLSQTVGSAAHYGANRAIPIEEIALDDPGKRPIMLTGDTPTKRGGDAHNKIVNSGYEMVLPEIGHNQLNRQPAVYLRSDVSSRWIEMARSARSASELHTALGRAVYKIGVGGPKRVIMGSPAWHGKNVFGRGLAMLLTHPGLAGAAMHQVLHDRFSDPERYYALKMNYWQDGGVPANRHNVTDHLNWLEQELSGQRNFGYMMRHPLGAFAHAHAELAEGWFWKTVDDVGAAAYLVQKTRMKASRPWMSDGMAGALAAEYGNNVSGMVNPLYMSKLWKWGRQMAFFAPSWWTTFYRIVGQSIPGSARLSHWLRDTSLGALDPVKFHSLDIRHRKELVRMHRSYFITYMAAAMVTHDMLNVLFSGHHVWDNQKGHTWDLEFDRMYAPTGDPQVDQVKHKHAHAGLFYNQAADLMNAIGVGHDWGFLSEMNREGFKKASALQKAGLMMTALGTGLRQEGSSKTSTAMTELIGGIGGIDPYSLLRDGQAQHVDRLEALSGLLPGGFALERQMDQERRAQTKARISQDPRDQAAADKLAKEQDLRVGGMTIPGAKAYGEALGSQLAGLPSLYFSGDEPAIGYHFLSEEETTKYLKQRSDIHTRKQALSEQLMNGQLSPFDWSQQSELQTQRYLQLLADTFGDDSAGGLLFKERRDLYKKYKLDDPLATREERITRAQSMDDEWSGLLQHASAHAKAAWWEVHTSQWTDADYLHWLSSQVRDSIAGAIDGEGGRHIRAAQRKLGAQSLPYTTDAWDQLRQQDPYLWIYNAVMKQLGKNSMLGALTAAYHNPFASFNVVPDAMIPLIQQMDEAGLLKTGSTFVRQSVMNRVGTAAQQEGKAAGETGGQDLPGGAQVGQYAASSAAAAILQDDKTMQTLSPAVIAALERLAQEGAGGG